MRLFFSNEEPGSEKVRKQRGWSGGGRVLDVSSNQRKPAGGTGRVGGVRGEHH